jgi:hypothetical protein
MPKVKVIQTDFSAGELSPFAYGRVDIARYPHAAKRLVNVLCRTLGGVKKRAGTEFIKEVKDSAARTRLIPYIINRDKAYMIEMGNTYARFYKPDGTRIGAPYEITTPYTTAYVADMDFAQAEDAMYLFHGSVYPNRLRTFADANWACQNAPFTALPFAEDGRYPAASLTLSANTLGTGRTMTASAASFLTSDVGRAITQNGGVFVITGFTSTTVVSGTVNSLFDSTAITGGAWNLDSSPQTTLTPSAATPVGATITLTLSADGWRSDDVGKYVRVNKGLAKITAYTSATVVDATIVTELISAVAAPALAWTLEDAAWSATKGYPRTGALHEQRLVAAGTTQKPQTVWGSRSGEPLDFTSGTNDDHAFAFALAGNNQANQIQWLVSARNLLVLTYGGEYSMQSGVEKPITPTNVQVKPQSPHGAANVKPVQVGKETMFVQRALRKLRAMGFQYDQDGYKAPDITTLSEHITETGIAGMVFQQEPEPVLWAWLTNGRLVSCTIDRDLDMIAFTRHEIDGAVESMGILPSGGTEQVWLIIRRSINGSTKRYIERMQPDWYPIYGTASPDYNDYPVADEPLSWGFQLDCALSQDSVGGTATWTAAHLNGETVRCIADGVDMGEFTVAANTITLPRTARRTLIGKMVTPTVELLTPEIQTGQGSAQSDAISTNEITIRVNNTLGVTLNGSEAVPGRITGPDQLDFAPEVFTGDKRASSIGWARGATSDVITQTAPMPFHLLAVIRSITYNGG